jgi:hypothetical protein
VTALPHIPSARTASREANHTLIATHVVLIGLTPFVPVPFVDDYLKDRVTRRLVRLLALSHAVELSAADVPVLADGRRRWTRSVARYALLPVKKLFKKTFLVLGIKGSLDLASVAWHRAFLLDHAFASGWCPPSGERTAEEVRAAIDAVCEEISMKPIEPALEAAFTGSRDALRRGIGALERRFRAGAVASEGELEGELGEAELGAEPELEGVAARMRKRLAEVPEAHFERLRAALARRLEGATLRPVR